jgi:hypothetical protein
MKQLKKINLMARTKRRQNIILHALVRIRTPLFGIAQSIAALSRDDQPVHPPGLISHLPRLDMHGKS